MTHSSPGRPRVTSPETVAEAACELFLERGYEATSIADIAQRAGLSRSSFFNYFSSKSDVLWARFDEGLGGAIERLRSLGTEATGPEVRTVLSGIVADFEPDPLALALRHAAAMGVQEELIRETGARQVRLAAAVAAAATRAGIPAETADVLGAAHAAAVLSAVRLWAERGAGQSTLTSTLDGVFAAIYRLPWA